MQLVFDALALGGQTARHEHGPGLRLIVDPQRGVQTPVLGQFYVVLGTLIFLALNGHLRRHRSCWLDSFRGLPVGTAGLGPGRPAALVADGAARMFAGALQIALPGVTALLVVNLAFGVMSRAAPTLNLFAVGFPVTLLFGFAIVLFGLPLVQARLVDAAGAVLRVSCAR